MSSLKTSRRKNEKIGRKKKKTFYSMDDSCLDESSEDEEVEILFMGIESENPEKELEGAVDLEA